MIAPCGMNCHLCVAFQFKEMDINKLGFHKKYCPGCIPRGENCTFMKDSCELMAKGSIRFCYECKSFPCKRLKALDKRYHAKYHMSMIENLNIIQEFGIEEFLMKESDRWRCTECGATICCHNGLCLNCNIDTLLQNKKYRWEDEKTQTEVKKITKQQLLRNPEIKPTGDVIAKALGEANNVYMKFIDELASYDIQLEWRYYTDGKAWLAKGLYQWFGVRGGKNEITVFWLSIWDSFFKVTIYVPEKYRRNVFSLPLDDKTKLMIADSKQMGNRLKFFPLVFDLCSDEMFETIFFLADFKKSIK